MNIEDYLVWKGEYSFAQEPFNIIDAIVFSELAYVNFMPLKLEDFGEKTLTLNEAGTMIIEMDAYELKTLYGGEENFFNLAYKSKRFGNVLLRYYMDMLDEENNLQFSAIQFQYGAHDTFVAFRGTDSTVVGWKEDFMISFQRTKAQELAAKYLTAYTIDENMRYTIGGHSKGGNLALYGAAYLPEERRKNLQHIYIFDAPGFSPEVFDLTRLDFTKNITTKVRPEFCVVSRFFELEYPDTIITESRITGTGSHDLITWKVYGPQLKTTDKTSKIADSIMEVIMKWAMKETIEERKIFVTELFDALAAGGAENITKVTGKGFLKVLEAMAKTSPHAKDIAVDLAKVALGIETKSAERRDENA